MEIRGMGYWFVSPHGKKCLRCGGCFPIYGPEYWPFCTNCRQSTRCAEWLRRERETRAYCAAFARE